MALQNQQASIQGLKTQIGQLAKLISKRPQGSLLSNTNSSPREQLNAITIQNEEGLVKPEPKSRQGIGETRSENTPEPCSSNDKGPIYEERMLQVEELEEWRTYKPRMHDKPRTHDKPMTHDKPKPRHDELNISQNQLKVGDKVLLDAAYPCIATYEPNGAIPLTILSIFPYGTVEVIHPKLGTFKLNSTRLKPYFDEIDRRDEECKLLTPP
ncbi:hypothetical protein GOBAR_AA33315 [Gossypium barbadense]|uniref:Uncharacterized protein n=1 Tax=Gossypium barbadense TaxID=3634 RepID=A0A2P5W8L3_GOSBA|nr:hypothetical protein GOBAR_AA33315 [Gossypium barbadense]